MSEVEYMPLYIVRDSKRDITGVIIPIESIPIIDKLMRPKTENRRSDGAAALARLSNYDPRWEEIRMQK